MAVSEKLKTLIIKTAVKEVTYDPQTRRLSVLPKELNSEESAMLRSAVAEEGHSLDDFSTIINDVLNSAGTTPRIQTEYQIQPEVGQHIVLKESSPDYGDFRLELLCIAPGQFIVLKCTRGALQWGDILESIRDTWNVGFKVDFKVFRNDMPFPDKLHLYQTYRLEAIELHNPPIIYEYLDNIHNENKKSEDGKYPDEGAENVNKRKSKRK